MPTPPKIEPEDIQFKNVKFFICACSHCGKKQEVFANEIHSPQLCKKCGNTFEYDECSFEARYEDDEDMPEKGTE